MVYRKKPIKDYTKTDGLRQSGEDNGTSVSVKVTASYSLC